MTAESQSPPPRPPRLLRRVLIASVVVLALLITLGGATTWWVWSSSHGLNLIIRSINALAAVHIESTDASGSLRDGFAVGRLRVAAGNTVVVVDRLRAQLDTIGWRPWRFDFKELGAERVEVEVTPSGKPASVPESIASNVIVTAPRLVVGSFELKVGVTVIAARAIETQAAIGPDGYRVSGGRFEFGANRATLDGQLDGKTPFSLDARGTLQTALDSKPVSARVTANGNLVDLLANAAVTGGGASGTIEARIASFDATALKSLRADLAGVDPRAWHAQAPHADLRIEAQLTPDRSRGFALKGPVSVRNAAPGTVDAERIPVRALRAAIEWRDQRLQLDDVTAELVRGRARGNAVIDFGARPAWQADLRFDGVDPATIHSRARPLLLDGSARVRRADDVDFVVADLVNRGELPAKLTIDLRGTAEKLVLNAGRLALGKGVADLRGEWQRSGAQALRATGTISDFEPALLVQGFDARVNGKFELDGQLQPRPHGRVDFELADSLALGRPLAGRGSAQLDVDQNLDVDLALNVRSARITARGGLGGARTLAVDAEVPALEELGVPVRGALTAQATLRGAWNAPAVEARVSGDKLRFEDHSVESLRALINYGGGADGTIALRADLANHRFRGNPILSMRSVNLVGEGRVSEHSVTLSASNEDAEAINLVARGGWMQAAWRGEISQATAGQPLGLRLQAAAPLSIESGQWSFGPAQFNVAGALVEQLRAAGDARGISTSGRFAGLRPIELAGTSAVERAIVVKPATPPAPLELRGEWNLRLADLSEGDLLVERSSGDLYAGAGNAMGLRELRVQARVRANQLDAQAVLVAERAGSMRGSMQAAVERGGAANWRLAQQRPWTILAEANLPAIEGLNPMLSDRVRANVRLGGALEGQVRIDGTPADPRANGALHGDKLRVAWIDQGVRLENGTLSAHLDGETIILDELRFAGPPRVRPDDKRAAAAAGTEPGFISATGRLKVRDFTGVIQVAAQRLPLLQRSDRWVIATGGANIEMSKQRVQVNAAVAADAGYVNFSRPDRPALSRDVVVRTSADAPRAREAAVQFGFDLGIDLGSAFYLRGSGLDTRVEGAVRLRNEGRGAIRATGAVEAKDGTYEGFGQKLAIERGRVNFQGAPENPGLDILALRKGLPVDVGVSITRTAANPLVRLYSDQPMADFEILSWLVLGRPADQTRADNAALVRAATGLLSGSGEGIPTQLARTLGIDEISVRSGQVGGAGSILPRQSVAGSLRGTEVGTASAEIITIGKRVSDAVTISYEQALSGAANVVQLSYQLSRRLSLVARAGTENALDLVYSIAFD